MRKSFEIRGAFYGEKTFPSLNNYLAEVGKNPKAGGRLKRQYVMIATNAIRRDLKRWKTSKPVILHYTFAEPKKAQKGIGAISSGLRTNLLRTRFGTAR